MTSLTQLNESAAQPIEVTDLRPAGVLFDRFATRDDIFEVSNLNRPLVPTIGIDEIINYSTANVRYRFTINSTRSQFITGSTLTFNGMPTGVSVASSSTTFTKTYTVSGLKSAKQFDQIKTPTWNIPVDYALSNTWWVKTEVLYYDAELDIETSRSWLVFDPEYYYFAQLTAESTIAATVGNKKPLRAALSASFDFDSDGPFKSFAMAATAQSFVTANGRKARLLSANLSTPGFTLTAQGKFFRLDLRAGLSASSTLTCQAGEYVRLINRADFTGVFGNIGPGGVSFIEGNGFAYATGLGSWPQGFPGITRIRPGAAALTTTSTVTCIGADARLVSAMVMSSGTMTVTADKFPGIVNQNLQVTATQLASAIKTASARSTIVSVGNFAVRPTGTTQFASTINSQATLTATALRIKQIAGGISSTSSVSVITQNSRIARITKTLSAVSSMSITATAYSPMILTYTITDSTLDGGAAKTVYLPLEGTVNVTVEWGDGTSNDYTTPGFKTHTYATNGVKTVKVKNRELNNQPALTSFGSILNPSPGNAWTGPGFRYTDVTLTSIDHILPANANYFTGITQWGYLGLERIPFVFLRINAAALGGQYVTTFPTNLPDSLTDLSYAFVPNDSKVLSWDTSRITVAKGAFGTPFNQPINSWNVGAMTDMSFMFHNAGNFNQSLNSWNTANVTTMERMFNGANAFNSNITSWNTANVTNMSFMFNQDGSKPFNQAIGNWNVGNVTNMSFMFINCTNFNQPLNSWNTSKLVNAQGLFFRCSNFNQPLNSWNVRAATNMISMFAECTLFNQDLSAWKVPLIPSPPTNFNQSTPSWNKTGTQPQWGVS